MGIKELEQKILEHNAKESARKERIRQNVENEKLKEKEFWDKENSYLKEKKEIVGKISGWRNKFLENKDFNDYLREDGFIDIFYGNWGHKLQEGEGYGCWSRIRLEKSGHLVYFYGYKFFGGNTIPEKEFAKNLSYAYLNNVLNHLESGKVYDTIEDRLKRII